jgi:hypothetical protein
MKFLNKTIVAVPLILTTLGASASVLEAPAAMVPAGLSPGDEFYIIFVTSTTRNATSTDIADYNSFVNTAADLSSTKGTNDATITWRAVAATSGDDQCDPYSGDATSTPIYNLGGIKVADDRADMLDATLDAAIEYNETGTALIPASVDVWTGCRDNGTQMIGQQLGFLPTTGDAKAVNNNWADNDRLGEANTYPLYAVSPKLAVPTSTSASASPQKW